MSAASDLRKLWDRRIKDDATARGLRTIGGFVYRADEVYIAVLIPIVMPHIKGGTVQLSWSAKVKPLVLDEILWAAYMPGENLGGPRKRLGLRVNGPAVSGLEVGSGSVEAGVSDDPGAAVKSVLDEFEQLSADFIAAHPTLGDYRAAVSATVSTVTSRKRLLHVLAMMAVGDLDGAEAMADAEVAAGELGPMWSSKHRAGVFELLSLHCKPPEAFAKFKAETAPTHIVTTFSRTYGVTETDLAVARDHGGFGITLNRFGSDDWALILRPIDDDSVYLQAAGSGPDRITVEIRKPGGQQWGAESVRYVVGHPGHDDQPLDEVIELPNMTLTLRAAEIFAATEAAELFHHYYGTGSIPADYALRPVEGWAADGTNVQLG